MRLAVVIGIITCLHLAVSRYIGDPEKRPIGADLGLQRMIDVEKLEDDLAMESKVQHAMKENRYIACMQSGTSDKGPSEKRKNFPTKDPFPIAVTFERSTTLQWRTKYSVPQCKGSTVNIKLNSTPSASF